MARKPGVKETSPRKPGGGRKPSKTYAERYAEDRDGYTSILLLLPNLTLKHIEQLAKEEGEGASVQEWIRRNLNRLEIDSRIL